MNAIEFAKGHIFREIDNDVLTFAFKPKVGNNLVGVPSVIEHLIIRNMVVAELNLLEGEEKKVPIGLCNLKLNNGRVMILEIPKSLLNNRPLLSADYSISAPYNQQNVRGQNGIAGAFNKMLRSNSGIPVTSNTRTEVMNENIIKIEGTDYLDPLSMLSVRVQNNPNMSNIPATAFIKFAELCEVAVQKWIYTHKRKEISTNVITGGAELVEIKNIVDEWSDAKERYKEERKTMVSIINMADSRFSHQLVSGRLGNLNY